MLFDLAEMEPQPHARSADVVVIGGGLAGLLIATRLRQCGRRVIVLESGSRAQDQDRHPLNAVVQVADRYGGAEDGRFRCLGGTSTRWGGAMLPFERADLTTRPPGWDVDWPLDVDELSDYFAELERLFALPKGPYALDDCRTPDDDFGFRSAKWPSFRMRNIAHVLRAELGDSGPEIWLNATASGFELDEAGRLRSVAAVAFGGRKLTVTARHVVVAAGAIESTRLLLLLDRDQNGRIFGEGSALGRYFHDHLSGECCRLQPVDRNAFFAIFALQFARGGMRDRRIELSESMRRRLGVSGAFAHVTAESATADGFTAIRGIYRSLQRKSVPHLKDFALLAGNAEWFAQAAYWRIFKSRLLPPRDAVLRLMLVIEQMPHPDNRITLAPDRRDLLGVPMAQIDWRIRPQDLETFGKLQNALLQFWKRAGFEALATVAASPPDLWRRQFNESGAVYHPGGSTRMGRTRTHAVLDKDLRAFAIANLSVVSTSAFPSGGSANPSFMLLAFALRAADRIARELRN